MSADRNQASEPLLAFGGADFKSGGRAGWVGRCPVCLSILAFDTEIEGREGEAQAFVAGMHGGRIVERLVPGDTDYPPVLRLCEHARSLRGAS